MEYKMIRKAKKEDVESIVKIYDEILTEEEAGRMATGWIRGVYPTEKVALTALEKGDLFVYEENGVILASMRINKEITPEYDLAEWEFEAGEDEYTVLHLLTVSPSAKGRGIGRKMLEFYEDFARQNGSKYLRMDTNERNVRAREIYAKYGFKETGVFPCEFNGIEGVKLVCLEKLIRNS